MSGDSASSDNSKSQCYEELPDLAFSLVSQGVAGQREDLRNLRNQASIVTAINGFSATTFSGLLIYLDESEYQTFIGGESSVFIGLNLQTCLAIFCFSISLILSILVMIPSKGWVFDVNGKGLLDAWSYKGDDFTLSEAKRRLVSQKQKHYVRNEELLAQSQSYLFFSLIFAVLQLLFWVMNAMVI